MRSALLCVFLVLIVHKDTATADEDFKPTPIPLDEWHGQKKDGPAETLQEVIATEVPSSVAVPAHYWEDPLRHSVYLTLVRDKIDQLIAKGSVFSPDSKLELHTSKEIDDHNLWDKIKTAPFDRLDVEEPATQGDVTIMSKGRLLEGTNGHYRFTEDKSSTENCNDEKCMEGVKAFWSVRRVRQRDAETIGKYHYELTFSVNSQAPKKHKKPYENPVRTFTVREGTPVEQPQYTQPPVSNTPRPQRAVWFHKNIVPTQHYQSRKNYQPQGLDRFFLSLFSSDEDRYDEPPRHKPNPYPQQGYPRPQHSKVGHTGAPTENYQHKKPSPYPQKPITYKYSRPPLGPPPSVSQAEHHYTDSDKLKIQFSPPKVLFHSPDSDGKLKIPSTPSQVQPEYVDSDKTKTQYPVLPPVHQDSTEIPFSQQVQLFLDDVKAKHPYPPPQTKYHYDVKSKVQPPVHYTQQHHYREQDAKTKNPYVPQTDYRYQPTNQVKTTRPAILPTPPTQPLNITMEVTNKFNVSEITTKEPEIVTAFKPHPRPPHHKPPPTKISYFPEHMRPPVFNAPPGVFVTMDKKPFKPMPPLKYHQNHHPHSHSKPKKTRPVDFRPSPQVVDIQLFSDPDPLSDAFRPMAANYADNTTSSSETNDKAGSGKEKQVQHKNLNKTKPSKKHELIKSQRTTTSTPDIITAQSQSIEESDSMHWANNLLSAFVKTTPMVSQETKNVTENTTPFEPTTTVTEPTTTVTVATTTEEKKQEKTTAMPRKAKRTRPPPKFTKPEKSKKHKRVNTTTTTTTTSTTTTTEKPRSKRPLQDLTPLASSAATGTGQAKSGWQSKSKIQNDITTTPVSLRVTNATSTTTRPTTTSRPITTTTKQTTTKLTTTTPTPIPETEQPVATPKSNYRFRISTLMQKGTSVNHDKWSLSGMENNKTRQSDKLQQRRKGSNFQGYNSSTPKTVDEDHHKEEHIDLAYNSNAMEISSTTEMLLEVIPVTPEQTQPTENHADESEYPTGTDETELDDSDENSEQDDEESKDHSEFIFGTHTESNENSDEVVETQEVKREVVVVTPHATVKNKTKCKKKKNMNSTTTEDPNMFSESIEVSEIVTTTTGQTTTEADIFAQIFGGYTVAGLPHDNKTSEILGEGSEKQERFAQMDDDLEDFLDSLEGKKNDNETNYDQYDEEENEDSDYSPFNNEDESRSQRHADVSYDDYHDRSYSFLELMSME